MSSACSNAYMHKNEWAQLWLAAAHAVPRFDDVDIVLHRYTDMSCTVSARTAA